MKKKLINDKTKTVKGTRPDTRQSSRGWLGRSSSAKTARNSKMLRDGRTDGQTDGRMDQPTWQGVESRVHD